MEIGLVQAFDGTPRRGAAYIADLAPAVEAAGFHSLWLPEHVVFFEQFESVYPYPPTPGSPDRPKLPVGKGAGLFDPLLGCLAVAMHTTTLRVGTAVSLLPLRHPLVWAREVVTLDHLSGGRFDFGVGVGWLKEEFEAVNVDFTSRGRLTDEYLGALHAAWSQEESTFHGEFVNFTDALSNPKPIQSPRPPVLIGGESDAALRRVARYGDGWYGWNMTPEQFEEGLARLDRQLAQHPFLDGRTRTRRDVFLQVGFRHKGTLGELSALADKFGALGAKRIAVSIDIRTSEYESRLREIADALGIAPL